MIVIHWKDNRKHITNTLRSKTAELSVFNDVVHTALWSPQSHSLRYPMPVVFVRHPRELLTSSCEVQAASNDNAFHSCKWLGYIGPRICCILLYIPIFASHLFRDPLPPQLSTQPSHASVTTAEKTLNWYARVICLVIVLWVCI